jgi:hypothetical protein
MAIKDWLGCWVTAFRSAIMVEADDEATARTLGSVALERLHASRFERYHLAVPVELVCVRLVSE